MNFGNKICSTLIIIHLLIFSVCADDCSVIQYILTENNVPFNWAPSNSTGCCSHEGISCVADRVVQINFSSKGYKGTIESLMPLTALQYINLSNCQFSGTIPSSIQNLSNLQFFYATGNKITGTIPSEIAISNLQFIDLSKNKLEGKIPSSLGKVVNLQHVNLSNNDLEGSIPSSFHSLKNIQSLHVSGNRHLSGEIPSLSKTLKECSFSSTSLCVNGSRDHCTNGLKSCNGTKTTDDKKSPTSEEDLSTLGPNDFDNKSKSRVPEIIALIFIVALVICIIVIILICLKRHHKKEIIYDKPVPSHSNEEIFTPNYEGMDITDPDASIQIHSLTKPVQQPMTQTDNDFYINSQTNTMDESNNYDFDVNRVSNYDIFNNNNNFNNNSYSPGRSPLVNNTPINHTNIYTTGSLNKSQGHLPLEQDLGDIIINNNSVLNDNSYNMAGTSKPTSSNKRFSNMSATYPKSQSSPNLVRLNRYSLNNQSTSSIGGSKRILTNASSHGSSINIMNDSQKLISSSTTSPVLDSKSAKHSSTPILPYIHSYPKNDGDSKRRMSNGNEESNNNHNTVHVANTRRNSNSVPYSINKNTIISENINMSNSAHSSTPIMNKSRNSLSGSPTTKMPSILTKFSNQNNMNASPLATSVDNTFDISSSSDYVANELNHIGIRRTSLNPSINSSLKTNSTSNSSHEINNKISNETFPKVKSYSKVNRSSHHNTSQYQNSDQQSDDQELDDFGKELENLLNISLNLNNSNTVSLSNNNNNLKSNINHSYTHSPSHSSSHSKTHSFSHSHSHSHSYCSNRSPTYNHSHSYIHHHSNISNNNLNNNISNNINNNNNNILAHLNSKASTPFDNTENLSEEIYLDNCDFSHVKISSIHSKEGYNDNNNYHQDIIEENEEYQDYDYNYDYNNNNNINNNNNNNNNIPENGNISIEDPQPPNYEEVFSETMYCQSPYVDATSDEAIRMQLEMRRIEERQLRMEYLQRQINNPEISNTQRQKYMDALDRLMLE